MRVIVSRLILLLPGWFIHWVDKYGDFKLISEASTGSMIVASIIWLGVLSVWDMTRRPPRTSISEMLARMLGLALVLSSFIMWALPESYVWSSMNAGLAVGFVTTWVGLNLLIHGVGHLLLYPLDPNGNYYTVRAMGWHPFWDRQWQIVNPDSDLVREGGIQEPGYTNFVPPSDWQYQCPACGARVETDFGICWRCNYGADGDSTAYYDLYGHIDQPPPPSYDGGSTPPQSPPSGDQGPYAPVKPRK